MAVLAASVHKAPKLLIKLINKATGIRYYSLTHVQALTFSIQNVRIVKAKSRFRKLQLVCLCECENSDGDPPPSVPRCNLNYNRCALLTAPCVPNRRAEYLRACCCAETIQFLSLARSAG